MSILVVGASGTTGRLLVEQLLVRNQKVKAVVRDPEKLPKNFINDKNLTVFQASILALDDNELRQLVNECSAIASCLGHNLSLKGLYGHPRKLVTESVRRLCEAIQTNNPLRPQKFILMNTAGNVNRDIKETVSIPQRLVTGIIRVLLPPHSDNEDASDYLWQVIGQENEAVEWSVVRPDDLINEESVSAYELHPSPIRSAIFNAGKTSRINVAHFMAELITDEKIWNKWKGQMPVIYNIMPDGKESGKA